MGQLPLIQINARGQRGLLFQHSQNAVRAQAPEVGQKRIGQAVAGCAREIGRASCRERVFAVV